MIIYNFTFSIRKEEAIYQANHAISEHDFNGNFNFLPLIFRDAAAELNCSQKDMKIHVRIDEF